VYQLYCLTMGFTTAVLKSSCTKTLPNCDLGAYFEREADSPKLLKILETQAKDRRIGMGARACKAGALPAELHAHSGS
jgi:hypothetical protein